MNLLCQLDELLAKVEQLLVTVILTGMVFLAFLQVVLRNAGELGLPWVDILLRHLVLWLGIVGASLATKRVRHIRIDVLPRLFPPSGQRILARGIALLSATVSILLGMAAVDLVVQERAGGSIAFGSVPIWGLQLILPVGFAILALRFLLQALLSDATSPGVEAWGEDQWPG